MAKGAKEISALGRAAEALEAELERLETMSRSVRKIRLNSEKNIAKAASELSEALSLPERLGAGLAALAKAMGELQTRQTAALEPLAAFASEIQQRMALLQSHMQSFAELGKLAQEVTEMLQGGEDERAVLVEGAEAKLGKIAEGAKTLFEAAHADDFPEVAREADTLKQRVQALRKRLEAVN